MITIGQIISLFLILIVVGWIIKKIRGIIKWGIILVLFLVYGLGYSWSNAINVPVQHAQRLLNSLPVEQVKNNTRFDNGVLSIQLPKYYFDKDARNSSVFVFYILMCNKSKQITRPFYCFLLQ